MTKILVTGGAGFIGSHLVEKLLARGHTVRVLDSLVPQVHGQNAAWPAWVPAEVERMLGDVRDPAVWMRALAGMEVVYHLAAEVGVGQSMYEIVRYMEANTMGTARLLEILAQRKFNVQKLIVASSMSIYGEGPYQTEDGRVVYPMLRSDSVMEKRQWDSFSPEYEGMLTPLPTNEEKPLQPTSIYAISKRDQEEMCLSVGRAYNIPTVALRFFNVYGPRQALSNPYTGVAAIFSGRLLNGKPPLIFEDGRQGRDFINVKDIVQGLMLAMESPEADYQAINLGTGRRTSVLDIAEVLIKKLNVPVEPQIVNKYRAGDIRYCYADISKARRLLGYQPSVTLADGIEELIGWIRQQTAEDKVDSAAAELAARGLTR
jgi:dTDP-L-rhamnose 4-epimerase